jgi:hypothetical protein
MAEDESVGTVERFLGAVNSGNVHRVAELCSDETSITTPDGIVVRGRDDIATWAASLAERHAHLELQNPRADGERVTGILQIANDYHRQMGVAPLDVDFTATVKEGKLVDFGGGFMLESRAKLDRLEKG